MECNGMLNATRLATERTPTGIPLQNIGRIFEFEMKAYRFAYRDWYRTDFLFREKAKRFFYDNYITDPGMFLRFWVTARACKRLVGLVGK
ncbi:hypothetical protein PvtlMGM1_1172 [Prevotella sp. MGM1]|nr:hypothetical protein PvtlMGM1_1172 [Prevotella sp. MGM1]